MEQHPAPSTADLATYGTLTSHLARSLKLLGLKRAPRDVTPTPTLTDYIEATRESDPESDD
jgi:hypothetical protein